MRNVSIIVICLFTVSQIYSQSGWFWLNPTPQGNDLYSISCPTSTVFYAVGKGGTVIRSTDAGNNWLVLNNEQYVDYYSCSFVNENTGFIAGGSKVIKTSNGGVSFEIVLTDTGLFSMNNVYFVNSNTGYAIGYSYGGYSYCYKTTNSGNSWIRKIISTQYYPTGLYFKNISTGFITVDSSSTSRKILMTTDSGDSWNAKYDSNYSLLSFWFVNDLTGYCSGQKLLATTNGGNTWSIRSNQFGGYICFVNAETGYSAAGNIRKTINGGINWTICYNNAYEDYENISLIPGGNVIAIGANGEIIKSETQGNQWIKPWKSIDRWDLYDVKFINETTGFISGYTIMLKTINAGVNWDTCYTNTEYSWFLELFFVNNNTGYMAEDDGVYKTTDCGLTWYQIENTGRHWTIFFVNENTGYTGGKYGSLMKTSDAGANWTNMTSSSGANYMSMYFTSVNTGYAIGEFGEIEKTTNAGFSWFVIGHADNSWLHKIYFVNDNTGFICGGKYSEGKGIVLKTTNAGMNWFLNATKLDGEFLGLSFLNNSTGFATGRGGSLIKTTNCGVSWDSIFPGSQQPLNGVYFINGSTGYIVGDNGTILKTTTGGIPIGIKPVSNKVPEKFILYQNYPNPFNPSTKIKFEVAYPPFTKGGQGGFVKLTIYDILGREAATLVNEKLSSGTYEVEWNASNFPSGVYFYKLETQGFSQTRKMILLK